MAYVRPQSATLAASDAGKLGAVLVLDQGIPVGEFLSQPIAHWVKA